MAAHECITDDDGPGGPVRSPSCAALVAERPAGGLGARGVGPPRPRRRRPRPSRRRRRAAPPVAAARAGRPGASPASTALALDSCLGAGPGAGRRAGRPPARVALALVLVLIVLAVETGVHSVHHLADQTAPRRTAPSPLASAHVHGATEPPARRPRHVGADARRRRRRAGARAARALVRSAPTRGALLPPPSLQSSPGSVPDPRRRARSLHDPPPVPVGSRSHGDGGGAPALEMMDRHRVQAAACR